jgi:hypothetical protein
LDEQTPGLQLDAVLAAEEEVAAAVSTPRRRTKRLWEMDLTWNASAPESFVTPFPDAGAM